MQIANITILGSQVPLELWTTSIGFVWTVFAVYSLLREKKGPFGIKRFWIVAFVFLAIALRQVTSVIKELEVMAGGLKILDTRYPYNVNDVLEFAKALGAEGRAMYAAFQLGYDTWAPPAFASFIGSVACVSLSGKWLKVTLVPIWMYLISVLLANGLMPVVILNYPELNSFGLNLLLHTVPWLDFAKYSLHGVAWCIIFAGWIFSNYQKQ